MSVGRAEVRVLFGRRGRQIQKQGSKRVTLAGISAAAFLFATVFAAVNVRLALGAVGVGGLFAAWAIGAARGFAAEPRTAVDAPVRVPVPASTDASELLGALLAASRRAGCPVAAHVWLADVGTPTLRLVGSVGSPAPDPTPRSVSDGVIGDAHASGEPRLRAEAGSTPQAGVSRWRFAWPVSAEDASGVAAVDFEGSEPDATRMSEVAAAFGRPLATALALHVARWEAGSARQLLEAARLLSEAGGADEVAAIALRCALALSQAETGSVMLLDAESGQMRIAAAYGLPEVVIEGTKVTQGDGIAGWVLATGRPLVVEDIERKGPRSRRHGVLSAASVPIRGEAGVLGVINVGSRRFRARHSRTLVQALEAFGRMAAPALRNAPSAADGEDLLETLTALALALETRDPYARGGTERIMRIAMALAEKSELDAERKRLLHLAVLLHDIGMAAAGDGVALTDRPLTTVEWGMLKMHPVIAAEVLSHAPALDDVVPAIVFHHERYDGSGYVHGLAGEAIPLEARILSVADAFVAMTSKRPYRDAMSAECAIDEIKRNTGTQFDPRIVEAMGVLAADDAECLAVPA